MALRSVNMRLSFVIPCFNEEGNIAGVIRQAAAVGRDLASDLEIVVVDDGSTDDTAVVLGALSAEIAELRVVTHLRNRGYGAAVRSGLDHVRMEQVFLTDGDGQFDLRELPRAAGLLAAHDVVAGYRIDRRDGLWRSLWGRIWTSLMNRALGLRVRDANCAFKLFPQSLIHGSELRSRGALISAELLFEARRRELSIGELPVSHLPRRSGAQTGASPRVVATAFVELARWMLRAQSKPEEGSSTLRAAEPTD